MVVLDRIHGLAAAAPVRLVLLHLVRGFVGLGALLLAFALAARHPVAAIVCVVAALVSFRGCPTCWDARLARGLPSAGRKPR
jgi:hypothetical protein